MFPCVLRGLVTLSLSWTLLEVPLDLRGLVSLQDLHFKVDNQFISLCIANAEASKLPIVNCTHEISEAIDKAVTEKCSALAQHRPLSEAERVEATNTSLWQLKERVASAMGFESAAWSPKDLEQVPGWVPMEPNDPLHHCGPVWARLSEYHGGWPTTSNEDASETVLVVGQYLAIDRDYLLRDLLGCIPKVRYCVENEADAAAAQFLLAFEQQRRPWAASLAGVATAASVGPCEPPSRPSGRQHAPVVLVRNLNRWGDPLNPHERDPISQVLHPLFDLWRPSVFIHLSEEVPREVPDEMTALYARARLVIRPFYHHHEFAFKRLLRDAPVLLVPIGYGRGTHSPVEDPASGPSSGVAAALEWLNSKNQSSTVVVDRSEPADVTLSSARDIAWAFAGRLGVHRSRTAMSNVFSTEWADAPSLRAIDHSGVFASGKLQPHEVAQSYRRSRFVPSPPGNSPDCFRHWEAVTNGAVPLLDGRTTDYAWGQHFNTRRLNEASQSGLRESSASNSMPFRAPLGVVFAGEGSEDAATAAALDAAGFDLHDYVMVRRPRRGLQGAMEQSGSSEAQWRSLLQRAQIMGEEELALRRDLNARYWVSTMTDARHRVLAALTGA